MGIVNVLPLEISNKIAAGEVVERPASVIKELVENAIDAGSTRISVEIKNGGVTYMRVTDNGCGMSKSDATEAFKRHATSKIKTEEDLDAIYTLGFRGEALSSIGAVSKVELYTKRKEDETGVCVTCFGGEIHEATEAGTPDGTTFVVNTLFYNTPARMRFLKRDATEAAAITDIMERFILSHPEISFSYIVEGKEKYNTSGDGKLENCIFAIYGKNYAKSVISVDYADEWVKITGLIGRGDTARPNRNYQSYFVNGRYIKSPLLMKAVEEAYKNQVMIGKYPMVVLNIEINPKFTDINVHPTKLEVKFSNESEIYRSVYHGVKNALYALPNVPQIERRTTVKTEFVADKARVSSQEEIEIPAKIEEKPKRQEKVYEPVAGNAWGLGEMDEKCEAPKPVVEKKKLTTYKADVSPEYFREKQKECNREADIKKIEFYSMVAENVEKSKYEEETKPSVKETWGFDTENIRVVGQIFDSFILAESGDTMIVADQHAAHERLKYEALIKELATKTVTPQMLMIPVICDLSPSEYVCYLENEQEFCDMGFEIESFGSNSLLIRATPEALDEDELKQVVIEIIGNFADNKASAITEKTQRALYTIACKSAVKANHKFDNLQLEKLLKEVFALENINTCPHGRPIIITMTKKELEKEFKRIL
ncbi:MAG: DNA mismatch repair endonuclease MutL [Ruminococcaceae bacterium]|nr:DNA mismatch repair endonuclease MutL [Oscillospiraceae bacterium]